MDAVIKQLFSKVKKLRPKPLLCPDEELLGTYFEGNLKPEEKGRVEEHLTICSRCIQTLISLSQLESSDSRARESLASKEALKKIRNLVPQPERQSLWEKISSWFPVVRPIPAMVTVSLVLAVIVFGLYELRRPYIPTLVSPSINLNVIARIASGVGTRDVAPDYKGMEIQNGKALHSGDMFKIKYELQEEAYVYLLSLDSLGNVTKLYPTKEEGHHKAKPNQTFMFPEEGEWLQLDEHTGQETFYLLASSVAIEDLDQKITEVKKLGIGNLSQIFQGVEIQSFSFKHE